MNKRALVQALSVAGYCSLVGFFMFHSGEWIGKTQTFFGPVAFLLMFSSSVLICALLVFYKPYLLFFSNKKKEAIDLVLHTTIYLVLFFFLFISLAILAR